MILVSCHDAFLTTMFEPIRYFYGHLQDYFPKRGDRMHSESLLKNLRLSLLSLFLLVTLEYPGQNIFKCL
jgi:hypothetical protein